MSDPVPGSPRFVERLLAERIGLDVASVGEGLIVRGVQNRMKHLGIRRAEDYERILLGATGEAQALIEEVVIPESWFFRDDRPFETFRGFVRAGWVEQPRRAPVSVLCLPCASGEEPYSIVMALLELGLPRDRFEVVAVDISERSIRRASAGMYGLNAFRGMDPALQARYFTPMQGKFMLSPEVRSAVRFEVGNVLDACLLAGHAGFDAVFCRNLLIYLDDASRVRAFANLDRLTAAEGLLFLGHADRADPGGTDRFAASAEKGSFAYRKAGATRSTSAPTPATTSAPRATRPPPPPPPLLSTAAPSRPASAVAVGPRGDATPATPARADVDEAMTRASALADQGRYVEAAQLVREQLGRGAIDARAHFLLGIIHQAAGDRSAAEGELVKAIYLDPEHDEALVALALLARRKGDVAAEATYRRRADRVMTRKGRR